MISGTSMSGAVYHEGGLGPTLMAWNFKEPPYVMRDARPLNVGVSQHANVYPREGLAPTLTATMDRKPPLIIDKTRTGTGGGPVPLTQGTVRRLTPLECERLQGFPEGWTDNLADTNRYRCIGNAVTVPVVEGILAKIAH